MGPEGPCGIFSSVSGKLVAISLTLLAFLAYTVGFTCRRGRTDFRSWQVFWLDLAKMGIGQVTPGLCRAAAPRWVPAIATADGCPLRVFGLRLCMPGGLPADALAHGSTTEGILSGIPRASPQPSTQEYCSVVVIATDPFKHYHAQTHATIVLYPL